MIEAVRLPGTRESGCVNDNPVQAAGKAPSVTVQDAPGTSVKVVQLAYSSVGETFDGTRLSQPCPVTRKWAFGPGTGAGVRVCLIDSGVNPDAREVTGPVEALAIVGERSEGEERYRIVPDSAGDLAGHGTQSATIIHALAPESELTSVRVLGSGLQGDSGTLVAGLRWAIDEGFDLVNLSLSTRRTERKEDLHDLADEAYHRGTTIVASAHNRQFRSYPWHFASVISVGSHGRADPEYLEANPRPPVEFFAHGVEVTVRRPDGSHARVSGNSFATPHVTGLCARVLGAHPGLGAPQLKQVLTAVANNTLHPRLA